MKEMFVLVRFTNDGKEYLFRAPNGTLERFDNVICEGRSGNAIGLVTEVLTNVRSFEKNFIKKVNDNRPIKRVLKKANFKVLAYSDDYKKGSVLAEIEFEDGTSTVLRAPVNTVEVGEAIAHFRKHGHVKSIIDNIPKEMIECWTEEYGNERDIEVACKFESLYDNDSEA